MIRGTLCRACNLALVSRWDDYHWRIDALKYLERGETEHQYKKGMNRKETTPRIEDAEVAYRKGKRKMLWA